MVVIPCSSNKFHQRQLKPLDRLSTSDGIAVDSVDTQLNVQQSRSIGRADWTLPLAYNPQSRLNTPSTRLRGQRMTTIGIDVPCPFCDLRVGELVDWVLLSTKTGRPLQSQNRFWHGEIVDEWNNRREDGHWFVVKWSVSNKSGSYRGPRTQDFHPNFQPYAPHFLQERCIELTRCNPSSRLHPDGNALRDRPR